MQSHRDVPEKLQRIFNKGTISDQNPQVKLVVLSDVDNTLINNDQVKTDVEQGMLALTGDEMTARFWQIYEEVRAQTDMVDIPQTLRLIKKEISDPELYHDLYRLWYDFPYCDYVYPQVYEVLDYLRSISRPAILSDGDASFQLRKIVTTGLARAVNGDVLIYAHKDHHLDDVELALPADHYVMIEDKPSLLTLMKAHFGDRITTILVKQGKYATDPRQLVNSNPDYELLSIGEVLSLTEAQLSGQK
jgi:FMN phosphatase YigB (HAD superfamily)